MISCNENRREVCAVQNIANKQIDRTFAFDKVWLFSDLMIDTYSVSTEMKNYQQLKTNEK